MNDETKQKFKELSKMTTATPFFSGVPVVKTGNNKIIVRESFFRRFFISIFIVMVGLICLVSVLVDRDKHGWWVILLMITGITFVGGGIANIISIRKLLLDQANCFLYYGSILNRKVLCVPSKSILLKMIVAGKHQGFSTEFQYGSAMITFSLKDIGEGIPVVNIAVSAERRPIDIIFNLLTKKLHDASDRTIIEDVLENGQLIKIPKTGMSRCAQDFKSMSFYLSSESGKIVINRSFYMVALWAFTFLFGVSGVSFLTVTGISKSSILASVFFIIGFVFIAGLGLIGIIPGFGTIYAIIDKRQESMLMRQGFLGTFFGKKTIPFQHLVGVQVCPKYTIGDPEASNYTVFEINIVVIDHHVTERFHIMSDKDETKIFSNAKQISDFIEKPIYDHR